MNVIEYQIGSMKELKDFVESRKDDKREAYYYGDIECFDGELYTIADIDHDACEEWFEDGAVSTVYEFEQKIYYAVLSEYGDDSEIEVVENANEAIEEAIKNWDYLTDSEKRSKTRACHESAIFACCFLESQILGAYNTIWSDGNFADIEENEKCASYNWNCKKVVELIKQYHKKD